MRELPSELVLQILGELPFGDLARCSAVCKLFHSLIQSSASLQYSSHLGAEGYVDGPPSEVAVAERLARLERHRKAWHDLSWSRTVKYDMPSSSAGLYELYGGVFARGSQNSLDFVELPSTIRQTEGHSFRHPFEFPVGDFTMDPSQDLLVLAERRHRKSLSSLDPPFRVHIRTLSTNLPHPLAKVPIIEQSVVPHVETRYTFNITILGGSVGVFFRADYERTSPPSLFVVWEWTTGFIRSMKSFTQMDVPETFSFLSPDAFVLPRLPQPEGAHTTYVTPLLEIYTMHANGDESHPLYPRPVLEATFLLPYMRGHLHGNVPIFKSRSDPAPVYAPRFPAKSQSSHSSPSTLSASGGPQSQGEDGEGRSAQRPFYVAPENRIICFSVTPLLAEATVLFTYASTLLSYKKFLSQPPSSSPSPEMDMDPTPSNIFTHLITPLNSPLSFLDPSPASLDAVLANASNSTGPTPPTQAGLLRIPWATWGPPNARWILGPINLGNYECYVYGTRFVHGVQREVRPFPWWRRVRVLDFNPVGVRRAQMEEKREDDEKKSGLEGTGRSSRRRGSDEMNASDHEMGEDFYADGIVDGDSDLDMEDWESESDEGDDVMWEVGVDDDDDGHEGANDSDEDPDHFDQPVWSFLPPDADPDLDSAPNAQPETECRTVTETSVIRGGGFFLTDVHSSLPYREITKQVPHASYDFMIDDERIICLRDEMNAWVHTM
ncbi:hypothetical protein BOTBODRAFT_37124 [Botryobasidium botryosum FD-172 SS1]|uniref:F-box domain-containing protein n=1 Tax=Botryobasidium botryosum (strain FD-172 SS1) TaxID=930990 RepID=A0A067M3V9_BOTB1|nr:hypothetical protein BOTBODRAFT_37124 [Botryobasidium botryosum FD-172 SS1]